MAAPCQSPEGARSGSAIIGYGTRKVIRDSVQSSAGLPKVHIFRCFQKICLVLCNSDIIFRITFIIKLQTCCGAIVTL